MEATTGIITTNDVVESVENVKGIGFNEVLTIGATMAVGAAVYELGKRFVVLPLVRIIKEKKLNKKSDSENVDQDDYEYEYVEVEEEE